TCSLGKSGGSQRGGRAADGASAPPGKGMVFRYGTAGILTTVFLLRLAVGGCNPARRIRQHNVAQGAGLQVAQRKAELGRDRRRRTARRGFDAGAGRGGERGGVGGRRLGARP